MNATRHFISANPLVPVVPPFVAGILWGSNTDITLWLAAAIVVAAIFVYRYHTLAGIGMIFFAIGWLDTFIQQPTVPDSSLCGVEMEFKGLITDMSEGESARTLTVKVDSASGLPVSVFKARITIPSMLPLLSSGDRVGMKTIITEPVNSHDLPDEFDYAGYLHKAGVTGAAIVSPDKIWKTGRDNGLIAWLAERRAYVTQRLLECNLTDEASALLLAMLTGDDEYIDVDRRRNFSNAGIAHILALSGMHVAIITWVIAILLSPLTWLKWNEWRWILTVFAVWSFAIFTGLSPSVTRATIMTTIVLLGLVIQRRTSVYNTLAFSAMVILFVEPLAIYAIGFQLTFAAVLSIVILNPMMTKGINRRKHPWIYRVISVVATSIAAVSGTGIIAAYYFHSFPLLFIFPNCLVAVVLPLLIGAGLILMGLISMGFSGEWLCGSINYLTDCIDRASCVVADQAWAVIDNVYLSPQWLLCYASVMIIVVWGWHKRRGLPTCVAAVTVVLINVTTLYVWAEPIPDHELYITRESSWTNILIKQQDTLWLATTAADHVKADEVDRCIHKYADYMGKRGIKSLELQPDIYDGQTGADVARNGRIIRFGNKLLAIVASPDDVRPYGKPLDYVLVCRGFTGNIMDICHTLQADSILLSADLNKRRHNRYIRELQTADTIRFRSLRDYGLHLVAAH